jgi:hypothetical protein
VRFPVYPCTSVILDDNVTDSVKSIRFRGIRWGGASTRTTKYVVMATMEKKFFESKSNESFKVTKTRYISNFDNLSHKWNHDLWSSYRGHSS